MVDPAHSSTTLSTTRAPIANTSESSIDGFFREVIIPFCLLLRGLLKFAGVLRLLRFILRLLTPQRLSDWWRSEVVGSEIISKLDEIWQWVVNFSRKSLREVLPLFLT
jgi:hypothetical protein